MAVAREAFPVSDWLDNNLLRAGYDRRSAPRVHAPDHLGLARIAFQTGPAPL